MTEPRTTWQGLPAAVRGAVEELVDTVVTVEPIVNGLNSPFAARLDTAHGPVFAKGAPDGHPAVAQQQVEALTTTWQPSSAPRLIAHVQQGGWDVLLVEWVDGRHADLAPGSRDLDPIATALQRPGLRPPPDVVGPFAARWGSYLTPGEAELLAGATLVHTDLHHENILISPKGAHFIDWSMPAIGPAWADVAYMAVRLMEWNHPRDAAVAWAEQIPAWRAADPAAVEVFVRAECARWMDLHGPEGAARRNADFGALTHQAVPR